MEACGKRETSVAMKQSECEEEHKKRRLCVYVLCVQKGKILLRE